ncbi:MAG: HlyC/CorC family transporter [Candidatus Rokubacteria bacterium]|nr:HlyC/CorC family transporter [Candidatus Rokubacteria bacterium]
MMFVWVILICLLLTAFFSAAEMAFVAANRLKLRHMAEGGHRVAARYLEAFASPEQFLSAAMMGVTIAHIVASSVASWALLPSLGAMAALVVTLVLTPIMLVLGEVIPKAIAQHWATGLILRLYRPLTWAARFLGPLTWAASKIVEGTLALTGQSRDHVRQFVSREELKLVLQMNPEESDVTTQEAEMIDKIFDLGETTVREVMVPLVDVAAIPIEASVEEAIATIRERGFSRLPVYEERIDHIAGVVTAMDLFRRGAEASTLSDLMRPATYVPETKRIDDLLREMQKARIQLAVVVDEYGGSVGIATLEDIIEEIVGEIQDEHDRRPTTLEPLPDGSYLAAGRTTVEAINEELDWNLPKGEYETLGGLILSSLHRIPVRGEEVTIGGHHLTVVEADERRIVKVRLSPRRYARGENRSSITGRER